MTVLSAIDLHRVRGVTGAIRGGLLPHHAQSVSAYIDAHLHAKIRAEHLSRIAGVTPRNFSRKFRKSFGVNPHRYLLRQRIERSKLLMLSTHHTLARIADECGFSDQAHLSKVFRVMVGENPYSWRRARAEAY
jgi:AraC family transcriptional regulator